VGSVVVVVVFHHASQPFELVRRGEAFKITGMAKQFVRFDNIKRNRQM
jgi:hypothetical protein